MITEITSMYSFADQLVVLCLVFRPNNAGGKEGCVHLYAEFNLKWNDMLCSDDNVAICNCMFLSVYPPYPPWHSLSDDS